ncbi:MAG: alpha/beta fold hydrolase [Polyangiaceae bacterium]|nr:alpha/beta fold hydrolase [Polyangiaceae bacterium]
MQRRRWVRLVGFVLAFVLLSVLSLVRFDIPREELIAQYAPSPSQFADIEGMRVHYRDEGEGPPLVLVHGTSASLHTWDGWASRLSSHRRVVRLDLRGFGLTGPAPDRDYRPGRMAQDVALLMDHLGIDRADIAGNSLGGNVAMHFALAHPERVRKLVLLDSTGLSGFEPPPIFKLARTPLLNNLMLFATPRFVIELNVRDVYGDPSRVDDALVDRYWAFSRAEGNRRALVDHFQGPRGATFDERLGELRMPVLVMWGARDRWVPPSFATRFEHGLPNATVIRYPTAGHVPMEELPEQTAADVDRFLGEALP